MTHIFKDPRNALQAQDKTLQCCLKHNEIEPTLSIARHALKVKWNLYEIETAITIHDPSFTGARRGWWWWLYYKAPIILTSFDMAFS